MTGENNTENTLDSNNDGPASTLPLTAFLVAVDEDGSASLILDLPEANVQRPATLRDARRAILELEADLAAQASAQYVFALSRQQAEAAPSERVSEALSKRHEG